MRKTNIIDHYGTHRSRQLPNNNFEEYTFSDLRLPTIYDSHSQQQFAVWEGVRHRHDMCEYYKSTQNEHGYRVETPYELENRVMSPGYKHFYEEITPERLARDPGDVIYNYFNGWQKNLSDGNASISSLRTQLRRERKGNYFRVRDQMNRFVQLTHQGVNGPIHHPDLS